ncbi:hypothetical protein BU24DRAFT_202582 [Aaosphaeria arxii CBS 175.79]|uniref:Uncharacterized protein n=1 Tax=Aaosphaeria arxii CBS 175.79 TaxID=1450172 RepID=A0A6A5XU82_9PLEO|nr:uncharacterized protein BU24DRAFT_202582 [Aaosphaeria arxii CBS 175.79]KAF2016479.1 hypothetical protein BU24DRAFT_202582 [Aaosphaeria arxii CBS 175.79]
MRKSSSREEFDEQRFAFQRSKSSEDQRSTIEHRKKLENQRSAIEHEKIEVQRFAIELCRKKPIALAFLQISLLPRFRTQSLYIIIVRHSSQATGESTKTYERNPLKAKCKQ